MRIVKYVLAVIGLLVVALAAVLVVNTLRYRPAPVTGVEPYSLGVDAEAAAGTLARAVQFRTVSDDLSRPDFPAFLAFLDETFPGVTAATEKVVLEANTPFYKWQGSDDSLPPVLLAAHYDVVPIPPGSLERWDYDPFAGEIADGYVWGRGTLDNKGALVALLTAAETLVGQGFAPKRTIYFSFGGDEEIGGTGAKAVAAYLNGQGVKLAWALDEGSFVLDGIIPGLDQPVASINLSEKGYMTARLVATGAGGHSSMPPRVTAVGELAGALDRLQKAPVPGGLTDVSATFFDTLGRYFPFGQRIVFANTWLFKPVLEGILSGSASTDAMLRTTTAPTMLEGSSTENVLPTRATAVINFRLHPRDSIDDVVAHVHEAVADEGIAVEVDRETAAEASPVSSATSQGYKDIEGSILAAFGPLATVPGLTIAATDARHYAMAAEDTYRINPFKITGDDLERFHGINERLSVENLGLGIDFYGALLSKQ